MYKKSIILTQNRRLEQFINLMMQRRRKDIVTDLPLLHDLDAVRNDIVQNKNSLNVRGEFGYFIKQYGFPFVLILDYNIDFSLSEFDDPDKRKLVRTYLLAFTILAKSKGFENAMANVVFIIDKKEEERVSMFVQNPLFLLDQILTKNERINTLIESLADEEETVKRFFRLSYICEPQEGNYSQVIDKLETIISGYEQAVADASTPKTDIEKARVINDDVKPANVICRAAQEKVLINGKITEVPVEARNRFAEKNIYISGAVTQRSINEVKDRVLATFQAMAKINPFKKDEQIFINLPDSTLVDDAFAISFGTFLSQELSEYTDISLNVGARVHTVLRESKGYFGIDNFIIKDL